MDTIFSPQRLEDLVFVSWATDKSNDNTIGPILESNIVTFTKVLSNVSNDHSNFFQWRSSMQVMATRLVQRESTANYEDLGGYEGTDSPDGYDDEVSWKYFGSNHGIHTKEAFVFLLSPDVRLWKKYLLSNWHNGTRNDVKCLKPAIIALQTWDDEMYQY